MKKSLTIALAAIAPVLASAQVLHISTDNITYDIPANIAGRMTYGNSGSELTIMGHTLAISDITNLAVDNSTVTDNTVTINYTDNDATITVVGSAIQYVDVATNGAYVSITQADGASSEITYILNGTTSNGAFELNATSKATLVLNGVDISSSQGAAINIQNSKRTAVVVNDGTTNTLNDCSNGSQKGCFVSKGKLSFSGTGSLYIAGHTSHGLYAKKAISLSDASLAVTAAIKDGVNCNQSFTLNSGSLTISGTADDGIQTSFKDDTDRDEEDTGTITILGGSIDITLTGTAAKGLKADGDVVINNGNINVSTSGGGKWDEEDVKTKASTCISADGAVAINGGAITLSASGSGGKGISCDGDLNVSGGNITVNTSGGMFAYVNGKTYDNYTGNTDNLDSDYKSSPKGIKADGNISINGGNIKVTTKGNGGEGIESKAVMTINDGDIDVFAYDDGLNSSSHMYINGGDITVVATNNDAIDSNGHLYIAGGYIRAFGAGAPEGGIDANEEEGYTVFFTGGTLIAVGGHHSTPTTSASTQAYISTSATLSAGNEVSIASGDETLAEFIVPENYTASNNGGGPGGRPFAPGFGGGPGGGQGGFGGGSTVLITCPTLTSGSSYTVTANGTTSTVKATLK